jgi:hypothetical protein
MLRVELVKVKSRARSICDRPLTSPEFVCAQVAVADGVAADRPPQGEPGTTPRWKPEGSRTWPYRPHFVLLWAWKELDGPSLRTSARRANGSSAVRTDRGPAGPTAALTPKIDSFPAQRQPSATAIGPGNRLDHKGIGLLLGLGGPPGDSRSSLLPVMNATSTFASPVRHR